MPTFQTYSAWIEVNGEALPEYCTKRTDMENGVAQITAWVPSVAGHSFRIGYGASIEGSAATDIRFFIDGSKARSEILHERWGRDIGYKEGLESNGGILPFVFGTCRLTDDDNLLDFAGSDGVGEIRLQVSDCMLITKHRQPERLDSLDSQLSKGARVIHETTKNGIVHSVQLGKEVPVRKKQSSMEYHVIQREERVHFVFYYRPLEILQAAGIAPRPLPAFAPAPPPRQPVSEPTANPKVDAKLPSPRLTPRSPPTSTSKPPPKPTPNASKTPPTSNSQSSATPIAPKPSSSRLSQPNPLPNTQPRPQPTSHPRLDPPFDPRLRPSNSTHTRPDTQPRITLNPLTNVKTEPPTDPRLKASSNPLAKPSSTNPLQPTASSSTLPNPPRPPVPPPPPATNNLPEIIDLTLDSDDEIVEIKKDEFESEKVLKTEEDEVKAERDDEDVILVSRLKAEIAAAEARLAARGLKRKGDDDDPTGGHDRHGKRPATMSSSFKPES